MKLQIKTWLSALLIALASINTWAQDDLLEADQAFALQPIDVVGNELKISWEIAKGYYLYQERISFASDDIQLSSPNMPTPKRKNDPLFGEVDVYDKDFTVGIPYQGQAQTAQLTVKYQGCSEEYGVCYPPQTKKVSVKLPASTSSNDVSAVGSLAELNKLLASASDDSALLDVDQAFAFQASPDGEGQVIADWRIADGYYLYRDKIKVRILDGDAQLGELSTPKGKMKDDPIFGQVEVYYNQAQASVALHNLKSNVTVEFEYQGCAEAGVCYPPQKKQLTLDADGFGQAPAATVDRSQMSESDRITDTLQNSSMWVVVLTFFVFGLLLSLTPCVFPMIPILSSIIVGQGGENLSTRRAFTMSLVFVLAMAITYTIAGVLAGLFGQNLQAAFQNPWILGTFAIVFVLLALSMFGFYELQLPSSLQSKITVLSNKQKGGTLTGVAIMGFLSALIVGPCVAPPLAGALIYIGQTGDALLGGLALFAMSMGMGVPLLLLGTSAGKLLPRAGAWMNVVKAVFGVLLLAVALWMADRILPGWITLSLWALLLIVSAIYMGALEPIGDKSNWHKLWKGLGLSMLVYGIILIIGVAGGSRDLLQPLKVFQGGGSGGAQVEAKLQFEKINSLEELQARIGQGQPVMLDFYADWCVSCIEMERFTFSDPQVQAALAGVTLLKADVTANNDDHKALMKEMGIVGPPAILFFNAKGQEQRAQRVVGFKKADEFKAIIEQALSNK
jgi:thiol:disulfide interchange protein DsbD